MEKMFDIEKTINDIKEYAELLDKYRALEHENIRLKSDIDAMIQNEKGYKYDINKLEEENENLTKCNLNLQEWLDNKEKVNKSLREELSKLKEKYGDIDY